MHYSLNQDQARIGTLCTKVVNLAKSFKPSNHIAAGYLLKLLLSRYSTACEFNLAPTFDRSTDSVSNQEHRTLVAIYTIKQLLVWVHDGLKVAKSNLSLAITQSAVHGYLHCILCCLSNLTGGYIFIT